ncbi:MAG TPA: lactate racemase domain-containing protein [Pirellulales bacterium]|nr:lactate racemase domain-containing protein [Pirellulales bacterium]
MFRSSGSMALPKLFRVRQKFEAPQVADIPAAIHEQLEGLRLAERIRPGQSVAITCGSRGVANIAAITRAIVEHVKSLQAAPFIVPAMGSHGGGTAEGQRGVLASYGVTEEFCGCPIRSSMETVVVCQTDEGFDVHFDKHAFGAEHVIVVNRVKPHTGFNGDIESGLMKMMLIGLGKHEGAKVYHRAIQDYNFGQIVRSVGGRVLESCRIAGGVAIVENGYDQTAHIQAVAAGEFETREKELLVMAKRLMPRLPFDRVDLLVVDEIGKNISGSGMDTNVVGRKYHDHSAAAKEFPKVKRILVRGLTEATHGNAAGIGMAEFCTRRALDQIDVAITRINCLTAGHAPAAMLPLDFPTDRAALEAALPTIGLTAPEAARLLWIRNTLELGEVECSAVYLDEAKTRDDLEILTELRELEFDATDNLPLEGIDALAVK